MYLTLATFTFFEKCRNLQAELVSGTNGVLGIQLHSFSLVNQLISYMDGHSFPKLDLWGASLEEDSLEDLDISMPLAIVTGGPKLFHLEIYSFAGEKDSALVDLDRSEFCDTFEFNIDGDQISFNACELVDKQMLVSALELLVKTGKRDQTMHWTR